MCSLCRLPVAPKPQLCFDFLGAPVPISFTNEGYMLCAIADPWYTLTCQTASRSVYSVALCWRKPQFLPFFWISAFSGVAIWQQSEKVEHGYTTTNLPLSNGIKIVSILPRLHGEIGRTIYDVQNRDEQTNRQTKISAFLAAPAAGEIRAPPNLAR